MAAAPEKPSAKKSIYNSGRFAAAFLPDRVTRLVLLAKPGRTDVGNLFFTDGFGRNPDPDHHDSCFQKKKTYMSLVFLIGFMGCGKTTHGRKLASFLKVGFVDLDEVFEQQNNSTIANYFTVFGEEKFRETESELLKCTLYPENAIVSTGGGLPCFFDNLEWMKHHGTVIYLQVPPEIIAARLSNSKNERPLLRHKTGEGLLQYITQKLSEREPFYLQASIVADGVGLTPGKLAGLLAQ